MSSPPALFGPYSLVTVKADGLIMAGARPVPTAAWYVKQFPDLVKIPRSSPDRRSAGDQDSSLTGGRVVPKESAKP
jgi:hypothetical protein